MAGGMDSIAPLHAVLRQFDALNAAYFASRVAASSSDDDDVPDPRPHEAAAVDAAALDRLLAAAEAALEPQPHGRAWRIKHGTTGRCLVAARALPTGSTVFVERPFVVANAAPGDGMMAAVALAILRLDVANAASAARLLQSPTLDGDAARSFDSWAQRMFAQHVVPGDEDGSAAGTVEDFVWALGVATVNLHAARKPTRGVMGLLASMMEHCCEPSARIDVAPEARGSALTLSTVRDVAPGESLSICYVGYHLPTAERRRLLRFQHGFVCECARCAADAPPDVPRMMHAQVRASGDRELERWVRENSR